MVWPGQNSLADGGLHLKLNLVGIDLQESSDSQYSLERNVFKPAGAGSFCLERLADLKPGEA